MVSPLPLFQTLVAFNDDAFTDPGALFPASPGVLGPKGQWTDISQFVERYDIKRGRQHELQRFEAGTCTIVANNDNGIFNPWNTDSPFNVEDRPPQGVPFQVRAQYGGTDYALFTGILHTVKIEWPDNFTSVARLQASDLFRVLALTNIFENPLTLFGLYPVQVLSDNPTNYWRLNELIGIVAHDSVPAGGNDGTYMDYPNIVGGQPPVVGISTSFSGHSRLGAPAAMLNDPNARSLYIGGPLHSAAVKLDAAQPAPTSPFTIEFWVKISNTSAFEAFVFQVRTITSSVSGAAVGAYVHDIDGGGIQLGLNFLQYGEFGPIAWRDFWTPILDVGFQSWVYCVCVCNDLATSDFHLYINSGEQPNEENFDVNPDAPRGTPSYSGAGEAWLASNGFSSQFSGAWLSDVAIYDYALSAAQVHAHYLAAGESDYQLRQQISGARISGVLDLIGWPSEARDIDAGSVYVQELPATDLPTTKALQHMQLVELTEAGALFMTKDGKVKYISNPNLGAPPYTTIQSSFTDGAGINVLPYRPDIDLAADDMDLFNNATVQFVGVTDAITARDPESEARYGPRSVPGNLTSLIGALTADAYTYATRVVAKYRRPITRVRQITINPLDDPPGLFPEVLTRELNDRIFLQRVGIAGQPLEVEANVERIEHTVTANSWVVKYGLADTVPSDDVDGILIAELPDDNFDP